MKERLSIDVLPEEHKQIKIYAALHGKTIREYVLESVRERLSTEKKKDNTTDLTDYLGQDPVLREVWDNEKDSAYDKL
jgi:plasmid stability protein